MKIEDLLILAGAGAVLFFVIKKQKTDNSLTAINPQYGLPNYAILPAKSSVAPKSAAEAADSSGWTQEEMVKLWGTVTGNTFMYYPSAENLGYTTMYQA